jgi:hypothetical protein
MSQACTTWRGDIGAYIIGVLDAAAVARLRRHLGACAACRADYTDLVPVRDWLARLDYAGGAAALGALDGPAAGSLAPVRHMPRGPAPQPVRPRRSRWRWLAAAGAAAAAAATAVIITLPGHARPAAPVFTASDTVTGVHGQARLHTTPNGTQISLSISGLPPGERCTMIAVSQRGSETAGTWRGTYGGTAQVTAASDIPAGQLVALRIESRGHRLLLSIPMRPPAP